MQNASLIVALKLFIEHRKMYTNNKSMLMQQCSTVTKSIWIQPSNKIDLHPHVGEAELIDKLQLNYVMETPWMVLPISALKCTNIEQVVEWLTAQGK